MDATPFHRGGVDAGEPLVLIHGFSGTWRNWVPVLPALEARYDVLAIGLAGHHGCPALPAEADLGVPALVDAIERDLDRAGFNTAHIAGNSLGGWIALELANRGRARSVVAIAPAGGWESGSRAERRLRQLFIMLRAGSALGADHMAELFRRPRFRHIALRGVVAHGERVPPHEALAMAQGTANCDVYWDLFSAIHRDGPPQRFTDITVPVTIAWGTKDRVLPWPRYAERFRTLVPDARWREYEGLGHIPMWDDPQAMTELILEEIAVASARPAAGATTT